MIPKIVGQAAMNVKVARADRRAEKAVEPLMTRHFACPHHREPFRASWPRRWDVFVDITMRMLLEKAPRFARAADGNMDNLGRLLDQTPVCEWLDRAQLMEAYSECGIGYKGRCSICSSKRVGTAYLFITSDGLHVPYKHVCFGCLVDKKGGLATHGAVTAQENPDASY